MNKILLLILLVVSLYGSTVCDEVTSIYDADTFRCNIKGYPPIRVNGVDAAEVMLHREELELIREERLQ